MPGVFQFKPEENTSYELQNCPFIRLRPQQSRGGWGYVWTLCLVGESAQQPLMWAETEAYLAYQCGSIARQQWFAGHFPDQGRPLASTYFQPFWHERSPGKEHLAHQHQQQSDFIRLEQLLSKQSAALAENFKALQNQILEGARVAASTRASDAYNLKACYDDLEDKLEKNAEHYNEMQRIYEQSLEDRYKTHEACFQRVCFSICQIFLEPLTL